MPTGGDLKTGYQYCIQRSSKSFNSLDSSLLMHKHSEVLDSEAYGEVRKLNKCVVPCDLIT